MTINKLCYDLLNEIYPEMDFPNVLKKQWAEQTASRHCLFNLPKARIVKDNPLSRLKILAAQGGDLTIALG